MAESTTIKIPRYRDADGNPTCLADARTNAFCPFLMSSSFGTREHCYWPDGGGEHCPQLWRRNHGLGTLIPHEHCPVWIEGAQL